MSNKFMLAVAAALSIAGTAQAKPADSPKIFSNVRQDDLLTRMFIWWDAAFKDPNGFTPEAFSRYYTDDAVMRINGTDRAKGLNALAERFRMIQSKTSVVDIKVPFVESFSSPDGRQIFTYHLIDAVEDGKPSHEMVMGYATIRDGKIALINFLSVTGEPGPFSK